MSATPFMPLWVSDFVGDTMDLDAKEIGAYMLILMAMWTRGGELPDDTKKLQRVARVGRDWPRVWASIKHYFVAENGVITNARLTKELHRVDTKRRVNAHSGMLGGRAKALKTNKPDLANATVSLKQLEPEPEDTSPNGEDGQAVDFTKEVFDRGVAFLSKYGTAEKQARSLIGKWRKDAGDTETFNALRDANREGVSEPVAWITARLRPRENNFDEIFAQATGGAR